MSGLPVVWDFRTADVASGGEGAPLVPFFHFACARFVGATAPVAFLNLGGVGNVTWVDPRAAGPEAEGALVAFDTGPGNALIDDFLALRLGRAFDEDGALAARGRVDEAALAGLAAHPYLARRPPKSLDRQDFHGFLDAVARLSTEDGAATLAALTARCVAEAGRWFPEPPTRWLVCGGGRRNATLMRMLRAGLERAGRAGRGGRARRRHAGGAGLRLPRRAGPARSADLGAGDHRRAAAGLRRAHQPPLSAPAAGVVLAYSAATSRSTRIGAR